MQETHHEFSQVNIVRSCLQKTQPYTFIVVIVVEVEVVEMVVVMIVVEVGVGVGVRQGLT